VQKAIIELIKIKVVVGHVFRAIQVHQLYQTKQGKKYRILLKIFIKISSCIQCPLGEVPNAELSICEPIRPIHLDWDSPWAFVPAIFSSVGLLATCAVTAVFIRYNYTPVVINCFYIFI